MKCILDLDKEELQAYFQSIKQPKFRCSQVWQGLYVSHYHDWDQFTALPKDIRRKLQDEFVIDPFQEVDHLLSSDESTKKALLQLPSGNPVETVLMKYKDRTSICISSQSGCPIGCTFCATGRLGLRQDLTSGEITAQILYFLRELDEEQQRLTNIVIMGMGEPFLNYENLKKALLLMNDHDGLNIGARRITVSTIGIPEQIVDFAYDFNQVNLAVSLHAPTNEQRDKLIPINRKYPIDKIISAVKQYITLTNRRVTFEYVLITGFNDSESDAEQLGALLQGMLCHVNLIPLNPTVQFNKKAPSRESIALFQQKLEEHHIPATIRFSKGTQIKAGCGQLAGKLS